MTWREKKRRRLSSRSGGASVKTITFLQELLPFSISLHFNFNFFFNIKILNGNVPQIQINLFITVRLILFDVFLEHIILENRKRIICSSHLQY